jgi:hypothetical protein
MTMQVFLRVASYVWLGAKYTYSDANGASSGIFVMWNPNRAMGLDIFVSTHFVATNYTIQIGNWTLFNFYAPNTRNGRIFV